MIRPVPRFSWLACGSALLLGLGLLCATGPSPAARSAAPPWAEGPPGGYADRFELVGLVDRPRVFTLADLQRYPAWTLTVAYGTGRGMEVGRFTGVPLWELLREAGVQVAPSRHNDRLRKYLVATGSDGYEVVVSLAELDPEFGAAVALVAYQRDGELLGPTEGMARLVIASDKRGGRLVSNLVRLEVRDIDSPPRSNSA
ncbi:MAG TPA: molybdopterin-dependent oxidoreductase [Chloroflexota bacterium]|nr:molybdopterin-dependent oxidoreductase [Chloroflexota bacterium]